MENVDGSENTKDCQVDFNTSALYPLTETRIAKAENLKSSNLTRYPKKRLVTMVLEPHPVN